jgi:hypothetical protein
VFHHDFDLATGLPLYSAWALPGTLDSDPGWRAIKYEWTGETLSAVLWADGDDSLDNVWDDRATLAYAANPALSLEAAGRVDVSPGGPFPGTVFDLGFAIPETADIVLNSTPMRRVGAFTGAGNEVIVIGTQFETSETVTAADWLYVRVPL